MEAQIKKLQENFYTDLEELKNKQREVNKTSAEMKSTLEGINNRLDDTKDQTSDIKNTVVEITKAKRKKIKNF